MKSYVNMAQVFSAFPPGHFLKSLPSNQQEQPAILEIPEAALTTDIGNSIRFINENRSTACYCLQLNLWAIWNGKYWELDGARKRIMTIGGRTILNIMQEANIAASHEKKTELIKCCKRSQTPARINGMLTLASPEMAISWDTMDNDTYLLNVQNGTINLRTGKLSPHNSTQLISKISPVTYDPDAECQRLMSYLESAFPDNPEMIHYVQKVFGYILTGDTREKCFFIFYGPGGNNGKSVLINLFRHILGPYALQTPVSTLQRKKPGGNSNDIVRLKGARFVAASEIDPKQKYKFDEALLKMLTGNDPVAARELFKEYIEYYPEFKLFIGTNHMPDFNTNDKALMDRVMTIPFRVSFPRDSEGRDEDLLVNLKAEEAGILNWAIEGCRIWQQEGLGSVPDSVEFAILPSDERHAAIDSFLEDCCTMQDGCTQKCGVLYDAYREWCSIQDMLPLGNSLFSRHLKDKYKLSNDTIGSTGYHWFGIILKGTVPDTVSC